MGLFIKDKPIGNIAKTRLFDCGVDIHKDIWFEVFSASLGKIMANQQTCAEFVVKGQNWNIDFSAGVISFGKDSYPVQFIGSESVSSNTWLWGWENVNQFSDKIIELPRQMKQAGEAWRLDALTTAEFELSDTFNGHRLSIVTCAASDKHHCYYRCPHANGAAFVAFSNVPSAVLAPVDIHRFISVAMECIQNFQIDHKIFVQSFLFQNDTPYEWSNDAIIAHFKQDLRIDFEKAGEFLRISNMKSI